jgi:hypothetical protein
LASVLRFNPYDILAWWKLTYIKYIKVPVFPDQPAGKGKDPGIYAFS